MSGLCSRYPWNGRIAVRQSGALTASLSHMTMALSPSAPFSAFRTGIPTQSQFSYFLFLLLSSISGLCHVYGSLYSSINSFSDFSQSNFRHLCNRGSMLGTPPGIFQADTCRATFCVNNPSARKPPSFQPATQVFNFNVKFIFSFYGLCIVCFKNYSPISML